MPNWRNPDDYRFTRQLSREQWAWEFLRRNPDYRREWQAFWETWQALEADYGKAPNRDFTRWKRDPRAYVIETDDDCDSDSCKVDGEKILIECHLGARWGFYKFPLNPDTDRPVIGQDLLWREVPVEARQVEAQDLDFLGADRGKVAMGFDLSLPLKEQLEASKKYLLALQRWMNKEQGLTRKRVATECAALTLCLRVLDALEQGAAEQQILDVLKADELPMPDYAALKARAMELRQGAYRDLLHLPER